MTDERRIYGEMAQGDRPSWEPLERAVGEGLAGTFMWMYEIATTTRGRLQAYKHIDTRRYLHLDDHGRAYEYLAGDRYREIPLADAITIALASWHRLGASPEELAEAAAAVDRARGEGGDRGRESRPG
jgi:hypothetical protein